MCVYEWVFRFRCFRISARNKWKILSDTFISEMECDSDGDDYSYEEEEEETDTSDTDLSDISDEAI